MKRNLIIISIIIFSFIIIIISFKSNGRMTKEDIVHQFYEHKEQFINIKDYLITKESEIYISEGNYKNVAKTNVAKTSFKYLFRNLKFVSVMLEVDQDGNKFIVFTKVIEKEEFSLIYSERVMDFGIESEAIESDWFYSWVGY